MYRQAAQACTDLGKVYGKNYLDDDSLLNKNSCCCGAAPEIISDDILVRWEKAKDKGTPWSITGLAATLCTISIAVSSESTSTNAWPLWRKIRVFTTSPTVNEWQTSAKFVSDAETGRPRTWSTFDGTYNLLTRIFFFFFLKMKKIKREDAHLKTGTVPFQFFFLFSFYFHFFFFYFGGPKRDAKGTARRDKTGIGGWV